MKPVTVTVTISAPRERVFAAFTDLSTAAERISGIDKLEILTEGPVGIGTRFRETRTMMGRKCSEVMTITTFDIPSRYVLEANSCGCHYTTEFTFQSVPEGTQVTGNFSGQAASILAKCMMFLMKPFMNKLQNACRTALQGDMQDVKTFVETGSVRTKV
jgi:carbon monoxide dehydrogenase subunit G